MDCYVVESLRRRDDVSMTVVEVGPELGSQVAAVLDGSPNSGEMMNLPHQKNNGGRWESEGRGRNERYRNPSYERRGLRDQDRCYRSGRKRNRGGHLGRDED